MRTKSVLPNFRISTKLLLLNVMICAAFVLIICVTIFSFTHVWNMLTEVIDRDMGRVISNSQTGRELSKLFADIDLLNRTFYGNKNYLESERKRLLSTVKSIAENTSDRNIDKSLLSLANHLESFLSQCAVVNTAFHARETIDHEAHTDLTKLENMIGELLINLTLEGRDTSFVEQQLMLVIGYRESLLQIGKLFAELGPEHYVTPLGGKTCPVIVAIDDLILRLHTITASIPDVAKSGKSLIRKFQKYREIILGFNKAMEELGFREANLNHSKIMSMSAMASIDKKVSGTTKLVNDSIEKTILSSGAAVLVLSIIVMIILGLTTTYLIRSNINNPMKIILKGIESFRKGKFDTQMEPGRKDEWGTIEKAFNNMASDLSRSYDELEQRVNERTAELTNVNKEMEAEIEERKRIEEALQKSEEKYRTILQSIEDGYFEVDIAGNFTFFNDATCKLLQYSKNELMGMNNRQYMDKENAKKVFKVFNQVYITGKPSKGFDYEIIKKDGSKGHIEVSVSLIKDSEGQSIGFRVLARDITERKQAEREKKKLEIQFQHVQKMEAIGTLASGVAHDFNNLLTTISMSAELALIKFVKDNRLRTIIEDIKKATQRGASLTSQLLAFSRRQVIRPNVLNLNEGLRDIGKMLERLIGEDIELNVVTDPGLWNVKADPGQIDQVIMNLSINARDAMPKGGKLTIETSNVDLRADYFRDHGVEELPGPYVMLAVSDTGLGIDKKTESHIFEPFFTTKEKGKGTGLGLSTVYGIIKQSGGYIWVYSEPGQGSTFKVYLPKWEGDSDSGKKGLKPIGEVRGSETVLIVEDDDMLRNLAKKILHLYGYMGLEARDGNDALRVSEEYKGSIQLMVTDVVMPEMSGRELADRIQPLRPEMKILYMSGYTDNAIVHHQVLDPHLAFLQKPFTPEGLAGKVREVLDA